MALGVDDASTLKERLFKAEARLAQVAAHSRDCIQTLDLTGRLHCMQGTACVHTGVVGQKGEACSCRGFTCESEWIRSWTTADHLMVQTVIERAKRGAAGRFQASRPTAPGESSWFEVSVSPLVDPGNQVEELLLISRDITERKKSDEALQESRAQLEAAFQTVPDGVMILDPAGKIVLVNEAAARVTGFASAEDMKKSLAYLAEFFDLEDLEGRLVPFERWPISRVLRGEELHGMEVVGRRRDTEQKWVYSVFGAPVRNERGEQILALILTRDITAEYASVQEQKKLIRELAIAKDLAEKANHAKSRFLANMSHEIRSPLNSVLGYSDLLAANEISQADRQAYANRIRSSGTHLLGIIDDILDLSKVESGQFSIDKRSFAFLPLVSESLQSFFVLAKAKGVELDLAFGTPLPEEILSDAGRLRQILMNLLSNSLKFTERGHVHVRLKVEKKPPEDKPFLVIDVEDTGIGIPEEKHGALFQAFSQGDATITRQYGGTGLGLNLSKRLAHALGGDLVLAWSAPGKGSRFSLSIPCDHAHGVAFVDSACIPAKEPVLSRQPEGMLNGVRILLVEDSPDNQALMKVVLGKEGASVELAGNGKVGVEMALRGDYDVLLMDMAMPVMDGLEATRRLRASGYAKPIIALTAHALKEEVQKSLDAGCDVHLSKPVGRRELVQVIRQHLA